jgi:hypothetical protein
MDYLLFERDSYTINEITASRGKAETVSCIRNNEWCVDGTLAEIPSLCNDGLFSLIYCSVHACCGLVRGFPTICSPRLTAGRTANFTMHYHFSLLSCTFNISPSTPFLRLLPLCLISLTFSLSLSLLLPHHHRLHQHPTAQA